jgi:predicted protein tyrosine phosphatase
MRGNKEIFIYSQPMFEDTMKRFEISDSNVSNYNDKFAFISILCPIYKCDDILNLSQGYNNIHWFETNHENVLNIDFYDLENDIVDDNHSYKAITPEQSDEIIEFIDKNQDKHFHCHCHAGLSRSSSVALFIRDYYDWVDKEKFDLRYKGKKFPNAKVFMELKRAYERKYYGDRE